MKHSNIIDAFMKEAKDFAPLTREDELSTIIAYKETGEQSYKDKLVHHNLRYIMSYASNYKKDNTSPLEMINVATIGFITAIEKYDVESGFKLITLGKQWMKASISEYIRDRSNTIRLPANQFLKLQKALRQSTTYNTELSNEDRELFNLSQEGNSLSTPVGGSDENITLEETMSDREGLTPYQEVEATSLRDSIKNALGTLPQKQQDVISGLFGFTGEAKTLNQVGDDVGISYERVRQLKVKALTTLQETHPELKELIGHI